MNKQREALELALEALEQYGTSSLNNEDEYTAAIKTIREALAEPEQEPVAWITDGGQGELWWYQSNKFDDDENLIGPNPDDIPLYTAPPARKPLTDAEIADLWDGHVVPVFGKNGINPIVFARAIERAHGINEK